MARSVFVSNANKVFKQEECKAIKDNSIEGENGADYYCAR